MFGLGIQELVVLLIIGAIPIAGVVAVVFLVLRSRKADHPERDRG